eukprot:6818869-Prymnesium_polylepis.1
MPTVERKSAASHSAGPPTSPESNRGTPTVIPRPNYDPPCDWLPPGCCPVTRGPTTLPHR